MNCMVDTHVLIVGGCGHVGLPFGIMLARAGLTVNLLDADPVRSELVRRGEMPFLEYGADAVLRQTIGNNLNVVNEPSSAAEAEYVVIAVGTPVDEYLNPRYEAVFDAVTRLAPHLHEGKHLVLR